MPTVYGRTERIGDAIQQELAVLIRDEIRDPRVGLVSLTGVEVSRDLSHAKVFVTLVDLGDEKSDEIVTVLNGAAGFLRTRLSRSMEIRTTPKLRFYYDDSSRTGNRLSALIDQAVNTDAKRREKFGHSDEE